jgi:hypothetical protein
VARRRSQIGVLAATGQRLLEGMGDDRAQRQLADIFADLDDEALGTKSAEELTRLDALVSAQVAALEIVRLERLRRGQPSAETGRPPWYEQLLGRAEALWPRLAALPTKPWAMPARSGPAAGPVAVKEEQGLMAVRRRLADAVVSIWRDYYLAAAQVATAQGEGAHGPSSAVALPLVITDGDPLAADPVTGAARVAVAALRESRDRLDTLVTEVEDLVDSIVDTPVHQLPATLPPAGAKPDDLPDPHELLEKFDPPPHLTAAEPALGASTVIEISPDVIASIREQAYLKPPERIRAHSERAELEQKKARAEWEQQRDRLQARPLEELTQQQERMRDPLPEPQWPPTLREQIASQTTPKELLRISPEWIDSWHVLEVDGVQVEFRVRPLRGRQISNVIGIRTKNGESLRSSLDLARNFGHVTSGNASVAVDRDTVRGTFPVQMTGIDAYPFLLNLVFSEHSATVNSRAQTTNERTIKNSTYASYLFSYTAQVEVRLPGSARRPDDDAPPQFHDGLRIVSGREMLPPWRDAQGVEDPAAVAASKAVHESAANPAPLLHPGQHYRVPDNAGIEALNAGAEIREEIQEYTAKLAPAGTWARQQRDTQLTMRALQGKLLPASRVTGAEIRFGGPGTGSQHVVRWEVELVPVRVAVLHDHGSWMDLENRDLRSYRVGKTVSDTIEIPSLLFGVPMNLLRLDWLEPFLFASLSLDAEHSRSGAGMTTARLVALHTVGEPSSVIELRATLRLSSSSRRAPDYKPRQLRGPVFVRALTKDVRGLVADFPLAPREPGGTERPARQVLAPENLWTGALAVVSELTDLDEFHEMAVKPLHEHYPGFLPSPDGNDGMIPFLPRWLNLTNKFAAANEQAVRAFAAGLRDQKNFDIAHSDLGYTQELKKADAFGFRTEGMVLRLRLRKGYLNQAGDWVPTTPQPSAWLPDSELDTHYTEQQDTIASRGWTTGGWAGLWGDVGIGSAGAGPLPGVEFRPMAQGRWVVVKGARTGLASWARHGFQIDDLQAFRGTLTAFLSLEDNPDRPVSRRRPSSRGWDVPGLLLIMGQVALLAVINPELTLGEALLILLPLVAHWLGPRALHSSGDAPHLVNEFTGTVPGPVNGPRYPMQPVIQAVREAPVAAATGAEPDARPSTGLDADDKGGMEERPDPQDAQSLAESDIAEEMVIPMPAPEPGRGRVFLAQPVRAQYEVLLPTSLTSKLVTGPNGAQRWVPYDTGHTDEHGRSTGVGDEPLEFIATEEDPFPHHLFVEAQGDGLVPAIDQEFEDKGFAHLPRDARVQIESAVAAVRGDSVTQRQAGTPVPIWEGEIARPSALDKVLTGHFIMGRVSLRMVVLRAKTLGLPVGWGAYSNHGLTAVMGKYTRKTGWPLAGWNPLKSWSNLFGLRVRLPVRLGTKYPNEAPAENYDPSSNHAFKITAQPQQFYRLEQSAVTSDETAASVGRRHMEIGPLAIAGLDVRWELVVETWQTRYLKGEYDKQERGVREIPDTGLTVLAAGDATPLGLMPEGLRVELDRSVWYRIPDGQEDTIGSESVSRPPNFTKFMGEVLRVVQDRLGAKARELVAEELRNVLVGRTSGAYLVEMSNGSVILNIPVPDQYAMPLPGGKQVGTLRAIRMIRITLKARLEGQEFMGVMRTRHYLGFRTSMERNHELLRERGVRLGTDLVRLTNYFDRYRQAVNAFINNWVWSRYGQTVRKEGIGRGADDIVDSSTDTATGSPAMPEGPAQFRRRVMPSAEVAVGTAPGAMLDAATLGASQTWQYFTVPEDDYTATTVITRHDTFTLDREGTLPHPAPALPTLPAPVLPAPALLASRRHGQELPAQVTGPDPDSVPDSAALGGQFQQRAVRSEATRLPAWEPRLPSVTLGQLNRADDFAALRRGLKLDPALLVEAQTRYPGRLEGLSGKLSQLLLPMAAAYVTAPERQSADWLEYVASAGRMIETLGQNIPALWANYVSQAQAGASIFHPRGLPLDYADLLAGSTYLTATLRQALTGTASAEIVLPGRAQSPTVTLEHLADVEYVHISGRETPNQMLRLLDTTTDSVSHQVEVQSGTLRQHWTEITRQLPGTAQDFNNDLGPLIAAEHNTWNAFRAAFQERYSNEIGLKSTHLGMVQVFLGVRYTYGVNPYEPAKGLFEVSRYWPGPRRYFRDDEIRWAEIWVPFTQKHIWEALSLSLRQATGGGTGAAPTRRRKYSK